MSWHTPTAFELAAPHRESEGHRLHSPDGEQLISLYAVEVSIESIGGLTACLTLLEEAENELGGPLAGALEEIREPRERDLADNFRRVLRALQIPAPPPCSRHCGMRHRPGRSGKSPSTVRSTLGT
ncbi:hypothetical protein [Streptomyces cyaneofuscatus]|uniref:hypothetical protein n=1 Tax=Streptomyces cyaneofuscatus TaxID=66883 RepID=UPI003789E241